MSNEIKKRKANLMRVIAGLEDSDVVDNTAVDEVDEVDEQMPEELTDLDTEEVGIGLEDDGFDLPDDKDDDNILGMEIEAAIEDEIQDDVSGTTQTTSEVAPGGEGAKNTVTTLQAITEQDRVASLVQRFDVLASRLEKMGMKKSAYRLDRLSDKLEAQRVAADTFKCPNCGTSVLKNTSYCVKCKSKVKEASETCKCPTCGK